MKRIITTAPPLLILAAGLLAVAAAQSFANFNREQGRTVLKVLKDDIKKHYYDPTFHSMDLEARFHEADEKLKQATSTGQIFGIIAQALVELEDSHTFFVPPSRAARIDYGWQMQMIGDRCYVVAVRPGSDAESKGLMVGDLVRSVDGNPPTRDTFWKIRYFYYTLRPQPAIEMEVQSPRLPPRPLTVLARIKQGRLVMDLTGGVDFWNLVRESESENRLYRHRTFALGQDLLIVKMPHFESDEVEKTMSKARNYKALILDLRGNPGGELAALQRLVGFLFNREVRIGDRKGRKESKPITAKTIGDRAFKGKLVVLVDSGSGSASEVLARVVQLEKRGTVLGDHSAGAVMVSLYHEHELGVNQVIFYGASITDSDIIMTDGRSLERVGVSPDELLLPTAADLALGRDPVLARATTLLGTPMEPDKAGAIFPIEWRE